MRGEGGARRGRPALALLALLLLAPCSPMEFNHWRFEVIGRCQRYFEEHQSSPGDPGADLDPDRVEGRCDVPARQVPGCRELAADDYEATVCLVDAGFQHSNGRFVWCEWAARPDGSFCDFWGRDCP